MEFTKVELIAIERFKRSSNTFARLNFVIFAEIIQLKELDIIIHLN